MILVVAASLLSFLEIDPRVLMIAMNATVAVACEAAFHTKICREALNEDAKDVARLNNSLPRLSLLIRKFTAATSGVLWMVCQAD